MLEMRNCTIENPWKLGARRKLHSRGGAWGFIGAILMALALAPTPFAHAADQDEREVRTVIRKAMENWSALEAAANEAYYTTSDKAVFFDFTPMQYVGWKTYRREIEKAQAAIREFKITLNDDLFVRVLGKVAWAHCTWKMDFVYKDGRRRHLEGRLTEVLERQNGRWRIVNEHASVPTPD